MNTPETLLVNSIKSFTGKINKNRPKKIILKRLILRINKMEEEILSDMNELNMISSSKCGFNIYYNNVVYIEKQLHTDPDDIIKDIKSNAVLVAREVVRSTLYNKIATLLKLKAKYFTLRAEFNAYVLNNTEKLIEEIKGLDNSAIMDLDINNDYIRLDIFMQTYNIRKTILIKFSQKTASIK